MKKWEHLMISDCNDERDKGEWNCIKVEGHEISEKFDEDFIEVVNKYGAKGWEAVGILSRKGFYTILMKRESQ